MTSQTEGEPDIVPGSRVSLPEHVVYRRFAAETVLLNLETGRYHGVNPSGGRMLEILEQTPLISEAAAQLAAEYDHPPDEMERDLRVFCADLARRGLVEVDGRAPD